MVADSWSSRALFMASASSTVDEEEDDEDEEDEEEEEDVAASLTKESGGLGLRMSRRMEYICFGGRSMMGSL
jgi:hypothetical protein